MSWRNDREIETMTLILRHKNDVVSLFELPMYVVSKSMQRDITRKKPLKLSYNFVYKIMHEMADANRI